MEKVIRIFLNIVVIILSLFGLLVLIFYNMGIKPTIVESGSMRPNIPIWSICFIDTKYPYNDVEVGDVIIYVLPTGQKVIHRVVGITDEGIKTKGDANSIEDRNNTTLDDYYGKYLFSIPKIGYFISKLESVLGKVIFIILLSVLYITTYCLNYRNKVKSLKNDMMMNGGKQMKVLNVGQLNKYDEDSYVWYACYGSNINLKRLMKYIDGDVNGKYSSTKGCRVKDKPIEERPYVFDNPVYFAKHSNRWNGGVAFLDYEKRGKSYGKIYKLKMNQFIDILTQEQSFQTYDAVLYLGDIDKLPVFSFTASKKRDDLERPSDKYVEVIRNGIIDIHKNLSIKEIDNYFEHIV